MKLYIGIKIKSYKAVRDKRIINVRESTMAYENLKDLEEILDINDSHEDYKIVEIEI